MFIGGGCEPGVVFLYSTGETCDKESEKSEDNEPGIPF